MNLNGGTIHPNSLSSPSPIFKFPITPSFLYNSKPSPSFKPHFLCNSQLFKSLPFWKTPNFKVEVNQAMGTGESGPISEDECGDLIVEACLTRRLPPALTLEHGLDSLKEAVQELKLNPPSCTSGMIRFEVAVPPSANALDWFCCQPESSGVFPQFYISKKAETPACESAFVTNSRGVFGVGAAVDFRQSSCSSDEWNSFRRLN